MGAPGAPRLCAEISTPRIKPPRGGPLPGGHGAIQEAEGPQGPPRPSLGPPPAPWRSTFPGSGSGGFGRLSRGPQPGRLRGGALGSTQGMNSGLSQLQKACGSHPPGPGGGPMAWTRAGPPLPGATPSVQRQVMEFRNLPPADAGRGAEVPPRSEKLGEPPTRSPSRHPLPQLAQSSLAGHRPRGPPRRTLTWLSSAAPDDHCLPSCLLLCGRVGVSVETPRPGRGSLWLDCPGKHRVPLGTRPVLAPELGWPVLNSFHPTPPWGHPPGTHTSSEKQRALSQTKEPAAQGARC